MNRIKQHETGIDPSANTRSLPKFLKTPTRMVSKVCLLNFLGIGLNRNWARYSLGGFPDTKNMSIL